MAQMSPEEFIEALESVTESLRNNKSANQQQAEQLLKSIGINKQHMLVGSGCDCVQAGSDCARVIDTVWAKPECNLSTNHDVPADPSSTTTGRYAPTISFDA